MNSVITVRVPRAVREALAEEAEARFATAADVARAAIVDMLQRAGRLPSIAKDHRHEQAA